MALASTVSHRLQLSLIRPGTRVLDAGCGSGLMGGALKKQADLWLRAQIDGELLHVFNMQEFQKWSNGESL